MSLSLLQQVQLISIRSGANPSISERTDIILSADDVVNTILQCISNAKYKIDVCIDYTRLSLATEIKKLRPVFRGAKTKYKHTQLYMAYKLQIP